MKKICFKCAKPLPKNAHPNRKYCSKLCKNAATKIRTRNTNKFSKIDDLQNENLRLRRLVATTNRARESRNKWKRQAEESACRQRKVVAASTKEITLAAAKVAEVVSDKQKTVVANEQLRQQLEKVTAERDHYRQQLRYGKKVYEATVTEYKTIISAWNFLAQHLVKTTGGKFGKKQKEIISFWVNFHKQHNKKLLEELEGKK